jgi:hypothetical protein
VGVGGDAVLNRKAGNLQEQTMFQKKKEKKIPII